jgi:hypothetical protein
MDYWMRETNCAVKRQGLKKIYSPYDFIHKNHQQNWSTALRNCTAIGTTLLAVEYDDKDACFANAISSMTKHKYATAKL